MAVDMKKGRLYLKRSWRDGDKTHFVYIGNHPVPLTGHLALQCNRLCRAREREDLDALQHYLERADPHLDWLEAELRLFETVLLIALGFHNPSGTWRKRQGVSSWADAPVPFPSPVAPADAIPIPPFTPHTSDPIPLAQLFPQYTLHPMNNRHMARLENVLKEAGIDADAEAFTSSADVQPDHTIIDYAEKTLDLSRPHDAPMFEKPGARPEDFGTDTEMLTSLQDEAINFAVRLRKAPPCQETADAVRAVLTLAAHMPLRSALTLAGVVARYLARAVYPDDEMAQYNLLKTLDRKRRALGWTEALPHERPFIDQLALAQQVAELTLLASGKTAEDMGAHPPVKAYWPKRVARTQNRLHRATRQLARLRETTRRTKAIQGDLARYLERIAPRQRPLRRRAGSGPRPRRPRRRRTQRPTTMAMPRRR